MRKTIVSLALSGVLALAGERALISDDYSNYFSTAKEIPLNTVINGSIETAGDIDIFKFTLDKDDGVSINANNKGESRIYIYLIKKETIEVLAEYLNEENWDIRTDVENNIKNVFVLSSYLSSDTKTSNLSKGEYFIVAFSYETSTTPYTFRIESEENTGNVTLDPITLEYCKNNPSECGIEVNSSLKYTQSDLDTAVSSAREDEKNQLKLTKDRVDSLGNGWSLIGSCQSEEDNTIFNSASSVWVYENGEWNNSPTEIKAFSGVWVRK